VKLAEDRKLKATLVTSASAVKYKQQYQTQALIRESTVRNIMLQLEVKRALPSTGSMLKTLIKSGINPSKE
jgi:hypothetical protein